MMTLRWSGASVNQCHARITHCGRRSSSPSGLLDLINSILNNNILGSGVAMVGILRQEIRDCVLIMNNVQIKPPASLADEFVMNTRSWPGSSRGFYSVCFFP